MKSWQGTKSEGKKKTTKNRKKRKRNMEKMSQDEGAHRTPPLFVLHLCRRDCKQNEHRQLS